MSIILPDAADREAASKDLSSSVFIDAGAGTGKTQTIVTRIINKILDDPDFRITQLAAITFTEKAGAELRSRFRRLLTKAKSEAKPQQISQLDLALAQLDSALIGTIHSFCKQVLTDHAIAANLPVGFQIGSENQGTRDRIRRARRVADLSWDNLSAEQQSILRAFGFHGKQMEDIVFELDKRFATVNELNAHTPTSEDDNQFQTSVYAYINFAIDFLKIEQVARRDNGEIEFDDLLIMTRDLLKQDDILCKLVSEKYKILLVDEFQDTDPIQWEIIKLITQDSAPKGSLVLVGDPKQSIYRFRNADINTFIGVKEQFLNDGNSIGKVRSLKSNFRSVKPLIDFVNWIFQDFEIGHLNPLYMGVSYSPLESVNILDSENSGPAVRVIPTPVIKQKQVWKYEFALTAREIRRAIQLKYLVTERDGDSRRYRDTPANYGDVCILLPVRTKIDDLIVALSNENIPFASADPDIVFERPIVLGLINALKVIAQTDDEMALWACLKSPLFGFTDEDLFLYKQGSGTSWDTDGYATGNNPDVLEALELLFKIRSDAGKQSPFAVLNLLIQNRKIFEKLTAEKNGDFEATSVRMLLAYCFDWENQGNYGLLEFLASLRTLLEQKAKSLLPMPDDLNRNAVQIMTIHAAKGLEFPITALSGLSSQLSAHNDQIVISRSGKIEFYLGKDEDGEPLKSSGYDALVNLEIAPAEAQELHRLLYVAMTRARDHLILSAVANNKSSRSVPIIDTLAALSPTSLGLFEWVDPNETLAPVANNPKIEHPSLPELLDLSAEIENSQLARVVSPSSLRGMGMKVLSRAKGDELITDDSAEQDNQEWDSARAISMSARDGRPYGRALHGIMDMIIRHGEVPDDMLLQNFIWQNAQRENMLDEVASLTSRVKLLMESPVVLEAMQAENRWPELHLAISDPNDQVRLAEGFADLVYESATGYVLVDYKTDVKIDTEKRMHYQQQLGAYALILEKLTGKLPERILLLQVSDTKVREIDLDIP